MNTSLVTQKNSKIQVGSVWPSNSCGDFKVLEYINSKKILVEFVATGYVTTTQSSHIKKGLVKDKLSLNVYGVGFVGDGRHEASVNRKSTKAYQTWRGMLKRCYCSKSLAKSPTYSDCTVASEWHNFQVFADWFELNYIDGFELDKDKLGNGNKVYSSDTCCFISHAENMVLASAKDFEFISPNGDLHAGNNIRAFAREHGLENRRLSEVRTGRRKHHKGWKAA